MIKIILNRVLIKPIELKKEHAVEGTDIKLDLSYASAEDEKRHEAARVEGHVVGIGETAYKDIGDGTSPVQIGDHVVFAKYAGFYVTDPDTSEDLIVLNDEDVLCVVRKGDK
jgi:co-chaperonin GroES (HSP10)